MVVSYGLCDIYVIVGLTVQCRHRATMRRPERLSCRRRLYRDARRTSSRMPGGYAGRWCPPSSSPPGWFRVESVRQRALVAAAGRALAEDAVNTGFASRSLAKSTEISM
jgi:hypothetical protein